MRVDHWTRVKTEAQLLEEVEKNRRLAQCRSGAKVSVTSNEMHPRAPLFRGRRRLYRRQKERLLRSTKETLNLRKFSNRI